MKLKAHICNLFNIYLKSRFACKCRKPYCVYIAQGGLANRVRGMLGHLWLCKELKGEYLYVKWPIDIKCTADFTNYFEKIPGIIFDNDIEEANSIFARQSNKPIYSTIVTEHRLRNVIHVNDVLSLYSKLKLNPSMQEKVTGFVKLHDIHNCIGIHYRGTDLTRCADSFLARRGLSVRGMRIDEMIGIMQNYNSKKRFFVATDSAEYQDIFASEFGDRVIFYQNISDNDSLRNTDLEHTILDLWILGNCLNVEGTRWSSFSEFAQILNCLIRQNNPKEALQNLYLEEMEFYSFADSTLMPDG